MHFVYKGANEYYVQWSITETTSTSVELCNETKPHISSQDFSSQISETPSGIVTGNTVGTSDAWSHKASCLFQERFWASGSHSHYSLYAGPLAVRWPDDVSDHEYQPAQELDHSFFCWAGLGGSFCLTFPSGPCQLSLGSINICPYLAVHKELKPLTVWIKLENSSGDGNTRQPDLPPKKPVCRTRSNS